MLKSVDVEWNLETPDDVWLSLLDLSLLYAIHMKLTSIL